MADKPLRRSEADGTAASRRRLARLRRPARRGPGHRGTDVRDTVAEMAARAHEISQEAGSKMSRR